MCAYDCMKGGGGMEGEGGSEEGKNGGEHPRAMEPKHNECKRNCKSLQTLASLCVHSIRTLANLCVHLRLYSL
jgi:hypothetical protein